jgi:hypothetical protein
MPVIERDGRYGINCEPGTTALVSIDNGNGCALDLKGGTIKGQVTSGGQVIQSDVDPSIKVRWFIDTTTTPKCIKLQEWKSGAWSDTPFSTDLSI